MFKRNCCGKGNAEELLVEKSLLCWGLIYTLEQGKKKGGSNRPSVRL
jgi:hypothetical protein